MKHWILCLLAPLALTSSLFAEDKVKAELEGEVEVTGISPAGVFVGDAAAGSYQRLPITGKVSVVTREGLVHRVETYTDWSGPNGVHGRVREKLYVSGNTFTGWTERHIYTPTSINFSRNVIDGEFQQEIDPDGSGFVEWTVTGGDNEIESANSDNADNSDNVDDSDDNESSDTGGNLPTVKITEEGEFDGVSDRRIEIDADDDGHPKIKFRDYGFMRVKAPKIFQDDETLVINQKLKLKGRGKGSLAFKPKEEDADGGTPVPSPTPIVPLPTATPVETDTASDEF